METTLNKLTHAMLKGSVPTKQIKQSVKETLMFIGFNGGTINTVALISPWLKIEKEQLIQKQIKNIIKTYLPNHAIWHFIEFLEKYQIKKQFLTNTHIKEDQLFLYLLKIEPIFYLDQFRWRYSYEGYDYWEILCSHWMKHIQPLRQTHHIITIKNTRNYCTNNRPLFNRPFFV